MDRTTKARYYNQFSAVINNSSGGLVRYKEFENQMDSMLKALSATGNILKKIRVDEDTNTRTVDYAYHGGKKVQESVKAQLDALAESVASEKDTNVDGNLPPPIQIEYRRRKQFTEISDRILNQKTRAAIMKDVTTAGGNAKIDKDSGFVTMLVPGSQKGLAGDIQKRIEWSDAKVLAGRSSLSALADGASPLTTSERAGVRVARKNTLGDANDEALRKFVEDNPNSWLARQEAARLQKISSREDKAKLLKAERTPGTPEFQAKVFRSIEAGDAREDAIGAYIKANPKSRLAQQMKERKNAEKKRKVKGAATAAALMSRQVLHFITSLIGDAVKLLREVVKSITGIGADVRKMLANAARFNLPIKEMKFYNDFAAAAHVGSPHIAKDMFSQIFGKLTNDFGHPTDLNVKAIDFLAPLLRGRTAKLTDLITSSSGNPDKLFHSIMDEVMSAIRSSWAAGAPVANPHQAFARVAQYLSKYDENMAYFLDLWKDFLDKEPGGLLGDSEIHKHSSAYMKDPRVSSAASVKNSGITNENTYNAADTTMRDLGALKAIFDGLKRDVFAVILANLGEIVALLRSLFANLLKGIAPQFYEAERQSALAVNRQDQARIKDDIAAMEGGARDYVKDMKNPHFYGGNGLEALIEDLNRISKLSGKDFVMALHNRNLSKDQYEKAWADLGLYIASLETLEELKTAESAMTDPDSRKQAVKRVQADFAVIAEKARMKAILAERGAYKAYEKVQKDVTPIGNAVGGFLIGGSSEKDAEHIQNTKNKLFGKYKDAYPAADKDRLITIIDKIQGKMFDASVDIKNGKKGLPNGYGTAMWAINDLKLSNADITLFVEALTKDVSREVRQQVYENLAAASIVANQGVTSPAQRADVIDRINDNNAKQTNGQNFVRAIKGISLSDMERTDASGRVLSMDEMLNLPEARVRISPVANTPGEASLTFIVNLNGKELSKGTRSSVLSGSVTESYEVSAKNLMLDADNASAAPSPTQRY